MSNEPATLSQAEYARRHGVSRKTVTRWKVGGYLVLTPEKQVDVERSDARLASRPDDYRGGVTRGLKPGNNGREVTRHSPDPVTSDDADGATGVRDLARRQGAMLGHLFPDDFARGAAVMAHEILRRIGSLGAVAVVANGGTCATAYGVERFAHVALMQAVEDWMSQNRLGPFKDDPACCPAWWPEPSQCPQPNWPALAADAGEPIDVDAWARALEARQVEGA